VILYLTSKSKSKLKEHPTLTKISYERVNLNNKRVVFGNKCANELLQLSPVEHSIISIRKYLFT